MNKSSINRAAKKINDAQWRKKTLSKGIYSFIKLSISILKEKDTHEKELLIKNNQKRIVFFGLGYNPSVDATNLCNNADKVYYLECEDFENSCAEANIPLLYPDSFIKLTKVDFFALFSNPESTFYEWEFFLYKQNLSLFPRYWNNLLIQIEEVFTAQQNKTENRIANESKNDIENKIDNKIEGRIKDKKSTLQSLSIFVAGSSQDLMHKEICDAVRLLGYDCLTTCPSSTNREQTEQNDTFTTIFSILKEKKPFLFLSVNGRHLDSYGKNFYLLKQLRIPIALWIVDNPWNVLSGFKQDWWKECHIYVTDDSFIPEMKAHGANNVYHLPLAASCPITTSSATINNINDTSSLPLLYVGHSSFRNKDKFFSAVSKNTEIFDKCKRAIDKYFECGNAKDKTSLVNFHKIYELFYPTQKPPLWPSNDFRTISHISSEADKYQKTYWLNTLAPFLNIVGDEGWKKLLSESLNLLPPVDYYTQLPTYYANAKFTLNITSLLMPNALTQRHFDVWLANGFLISTPTHGLNIFDTDVTNLIVAKAPEITLNLVEKYTTKPKLYNEIKSHMKEIILNQHSYLDRLRVIINHI